MRPSKTPISTIVFLSMLAAAAPLWAEVKPNPLFADGAVLQRDREVPVWGTAREGEKVTVEFGDQKLTTTHTGSGPMAKGGDLQGFTIAGADDKFVPAKAEIQGDQVVVSSPDVASPVAVRYAWSNFPVVNFYNREGLPASPFRTDVN